MNKERVTIIPCPNAQNPRAFGIVASEGTDISDELKKVNQKD